MSISIQHLEYYLPNGVPVFNDLHLSVQKAQKAALTGSNGAGKTTLLKMIAGHETQYTGEIIIDGTLYFVPQHYGHFDGLTVAAALGIEPIIQALRAVENGATGQHYYDLLEHNWDITARCEQAFRSWGITGISLTQPVGELSGGMKTRLFLSGMDICEPGNVLLDEPTNHLDRKARQRLYEWIEHSSCTLLITSHDRQLLQLCEPVLELSSGNITVYGGSYDLYKEQKDLATAAQEHRLAYHEKMLKEARKKKQQALERKQRSDARAEKKSNNSSEPKILMNSRRNSAEASTSALKLVHEAKLGKLRDSLQQAAEIVQMQRIMKAYFEQPVMPAGKTLIQATGLNYSYGNGHMLWQKPLGFTIRSGDRLAITGDNGTGKTTLLNLLQGTIQPSGGSLQSGNFKQLLLDQDYRLIDRGKTVLEQVLHFNESKLEPSTVHTLMAGFLFMPESWNKTCSVLSGGEMLRLALCCMVLQNRAPDIIFLDEPVNNLDLENINMLAKIFLEYNGTLVVVSHDDNFLSDIAIADTIQLD
jgi:ATPase subunit of ABC transporter with duplicated ATPase domains